MSMYIPPGDQGPTGAEGGEFIDAPEGDVPEIEHPVRLADESVEDVRRRARAAGQGAPTEPDEG